MKERVIQGACPVGEELCIATRPTPLLLVVYWQSCLSIREPDRLFGLSTTTLVEQVITSIYAPGT
jgi:hypothetical protein